jgi:hypothetical protein
VLEAGRIVEESPHDQLVGGGGRYTGRYGGWGSAVT